MSNIEIEPLETQVIENEFDGKIINTNVIGANDLDRIFITNSAVNAIHNELSENFINDEYFIRLATRSMGCLGMQFKIGFDNKMSEDDRQYELDGIKIVIDSHSVFYFMGVIVDFVDNINGTGFVFNNPHTQPTCGCSH